MANQELVAYLQRQVEQNLPKEKVREKLISAGWKNEEINEGLLEVSRQSIKTKGVINQDIKNLETLFAPLKIVESDLSNIIKEKPTENGLENKLEYINFKAFAGFILTGV